MKLYNVALSFAFVLLGSSSVLAQQQWTKVGQDSQGDTYYVEASSIQRNGIFRIYAVFTEYTKPQEITPGVTAVSGVAFQKTNCQTRTTQIRAVRYMGANNAIVLQEADSDRAPFLSPPPGTIGRAVADFVCR